ncbi:hypothetical protein [Robertmurraya andreesenii]|uniref:Group-specific protein n=1 Tax=Anoxybacillus andreesenii TaxID=1325932 RepID=A0ABT9V2H0_9BACL|nr:hypothetical protein [Robertmurraya andreesenii]MDQ0155134.1 hypothetical protein [Robertmurraya andreesenii]
MFDPTAFDNMKVVLEGALYDRDLAGEIAILDRNDVVNIAKLTRSYSINFAETRESKVYCTLILDAKLENLASELLRTQLNGPLAGAHLAIVFHMKHENKREIYKEIDHQLRNIWGVERHISQRISHDPTDNLRWVSNEITIEFNRLILEEQMDDLIVMLDYITETLAKLNSLLV